MTLTQLSTERGADSMQATAEGAIEGPRVSIVVPSRQIDDYVRECATGCLRLSGVRPEVILLPDSYSPEDVRDLPPEVTVIATGPVLPGAKRNLGTRMASTEVVAYIDADAYPRADWLERALRHLANHEIGAVGGPGLTPREDSLVQRLSGEIYASPMMGRGSRIRYVPGRQQEVADLPSCNFVARRDAVLEAGGWSEAYWPGEDTLLCLAIAQRGKKILYSPDVQVYHHRRSSFRAHLRQVWNFGVSRGFFFKRFPANSRRLLYVLPSAALLYLIGFAVLWLARLGDVLIWALPLLAYIILIVIGSFMSSQRKFIPLVWLGVLVSHLAYGGAFIQGLLSKDVSRTGGSDG